MRKFFKLGKRAPRVGALAALFATAGALTGCDDFLKATNPGAVEEWQLEQESYLTVLSNGVLGAFQPAVNYMAHYSGVFTDELTSSHVFRQNRELDIREVDENNGTAAGIYTRLQRSRFMADTVTSRLKVMLKEEAARDLRVARSLAVAGYSYTLLGEAMCAAPVNLSAPKSPDELQTIALARFDEAIQVAQAARAHNAAISPQTTATKRLVAGADSVLNLARVGAARAALDRGDKALAVQYAKDVPASFAYHVYYVESDVDGTLANGFYNVASTPAGAGARSINLAFTPFENMDDPRIPREMQTISNWRGSYPVPKTTRPYSNWSPDRVVDWTRTVSMELASGLEARYVLAEAGAMSQAELLAFINERRAVGKQAPIAGGNLQAELREQRARDFFLSGRRLGDLRRYKDKYGVDLWQRGEYPFTTTGETYGEQFCLPIPQSELDGNPNA